VLNATFATTATLLSEWAAFLNVFMAVPLWTFNASHDELCEGVGSIYYLLNVFWQWYWNLFWKI